MKITLLGKHAQDETELSSSRKVFLRKTARGAVVKVLRQHYLRDDVPCGSQLCTACNAFYEKQPNLREGKSKSKSKPVLSKSGRDPLSVTKNCRHYVLLDTNIILHQMDLVESTDFGKDIIILQTVLEEVRHRSMPLYVRTMRLIADETRRVFVFANEAQASTYVERLPEETPNDRNDRAIRQASRWYTQHLATAMAGSSDRHSIVTVVMLSQDVDNIRKANAAGILAISLKTYVEKLPSANLLDMLALSTEAVSEKSTTSLSTRKEIYFAEYLSTSTTMAGLKNQSLHKGIFNPNPYNYLEATVKVPAFEKPVLVLGKTNMNRATSGDTVAIQVLPEDEWRKPTDNVVERTTKNHDNPDEEEEAGSSSSDSDGEETVKQSNTSTELKPMPTAKVVGIIKRAWRSYVCHIDKESVSSSGMDSLAPQNVFALPVDRKIPKIRIRTRQLRALYNQKFLVAIDSWDVSSRSPNGHFIRALGGVDNKEAEIESLLLEYDVPYRPFPKAILDCLPEEGDKWKVPQKAADPSIWNNREDLRDLIVCSIDPIGCQDIDDALHARQLKNGNIECGVHIADVSHFVQSNNAMDSEAASRGTTVYLVDKRIDMLPPLLGTNLCSLRPYVERLAFSVIWEMDQNANIKTVRFTKSVIASKAAFSYEDAQIRKDDVSQNDALTTSIRMLNELAIKLKAKRIAAGALNLASPEVKIHMDSSESTGPIDVEQKKLLETNSLVEEFMLLANISVAQRIFDQFPQTAVLRRHLAPPAENFEVLADVLAKRRNLTLDISSSGSLADSLDRCIDPKEPAFNTLVRIMATRCMLPAEYFCSGSVAKDTFRHYGLASSIYTHFTSPIRRYADVLVHRELFAAISATPLDSTLHASNHVEEIMDNINKRHRAAQRAGRASVDVYVALSLRSKQKDESAGLVEEAFVIRTFSNGLAVFVSKLGLEGLVVFKKDIVHDAEKYEIEVKDAGGRPLRIGVFDRVKVEIIVDRDEYTQKGKVRMHLVSPIDSRQIQ